MQKLSVFTNSLRDHSLVCPAMDCVKSEHYLEIRFGTVRSYVQQMNYVKKQQLSQFRFENIRSLCPPNVCCEK
jgi:hypothetical protein